MDPGPPAADTQLIACLRMSLHSLHASLLHRGTEGMHLGFRKPQSLLQHMIGHACTFMYVGLFESERRVSTP